MKRATMNVKIDIHRLQQLWDIEHAARAYVEHRYDGAAYLVGTDYEAKESVLLVALAERVRALETR